MIFAKCVLNFKFFSACPTGATSDGTAACACAANFQVDTAGTACEGKSQGISNDTRQLIIKVIKMKQK